MTGKGPGCVPRLTRAASCLCCVFSAGHDRSVRLLEPPRASLDAARPVHQLCSAGPRASRIRQWQGRVSAPVPLCASRAASTAQAAAAEHVQALVLCRFRLLNHRDTYAVAFLRGGIFKPQVAALVRPQAMPILAPPQCRGSRCDEASTLCLRLCSLSPS